MIVGITLVRNGNLLNYPWKICIQQLLKLCDLVVVNCNSNNDDNTLEELLTIADQNPQIAIITEPWDMNNTGDGRELAIQANIALNVAEVIPESWIIYLQADEIIHDNDMLPIKQYLSELPSSISQVELYRTYFWKNLDQRLLSDEIWLGRIFRSGTHKVGGDGMYLIRESGEVIRSPFWIYHYSRIGSEDLINNRLRTLDRLFHPKEEVDLYEKFNYDRAALLKTVVPFNGTHPYGIQDFYR